MIAPAFEARTQVWRLALYIAAAIAFVLAGIWMVGGFGADHPEGGEAMLVGWASILFFGFCGVVLARRTFDTGPVIRVDSQGIWAKNWSDATIPWAEITDLHFFTMHRQKMLGLVLRDISRFPPTGIAGRLAGANRAFTGVDAIWLTTNGTDKSFADLEAAVTAQRQR
jgi:hypothetical protein